MGKFPMWGEVRGVPSPTGSRGRACYCVEAGLGQSYLTRDHRIRHVQYFFDLDHICNFKTLFFFFVMNFYIIFVLLSLSNVLCIVDYLRFQSFAKNT